MALSDLEWAATAHLGDEPRFPTRDFPNCGLSQEEMDNVKSVLKKRGLALQIHNNEKYVVVPKR